MRSMFAAAAVVLTGCSLVAGEEEPTAQELQAQHIEAYEELEAELAARRVTLGEDRLDVTAVGSTVYWLNYHNQWDPTLYAMEQGVTYEIGLLDGDAPGFRAAAGRVVTVHAEPSEVTYRSFAVDGTELGTFTTPPPEGGVRWWAFDTDADYLYLVDEDRQVVDRVPHGGGAREQVLAFADVGVELSWFWDFGLDSDELVFVDAGSIGIVDLNAGTTEWVGNGTEARAVGTIDDLVLYATTDEVLVVDRSDGSEVSLVDVVEGAGYDLNDTYVDIDLPSSNHFSIAGSVVVYEGQGGVMAYDFATNTVEPVLLEPRNTSERYLRPVITDDGVVYTMGELEGRTTMYEVRHPALTD